MYRVTLRLHDIKRLQSPLNTYTIKINLADIFFLFDESPLSIFPLFAYIATAKSGVSAENTGIKVSALSLS